MIQRRRFKRPTDALVRPVAVSTCDVDQAIIHRLVPGTETPPVFVQEPAGAELSQR